MDRFGDQIPWGDPTWYQGWHSPYYKESHRKLREAVRAFVEKEMKPFAQQWEDERRLPMELRRKAYEAGILPGILGGQWPTEFVGRHIAGGVTPEEWDNFHSLVVGDELSRCGVSGVVGGLTTGLAVGLPPILHFGHADMQKAVAPACLKGDKVICLAITEPSVGSDVANLATSAVKSADGSHYVVNGEKKWITNGMFADYFTVAVRTGGPGMGGISFLLLERSMPGISTRPIQCQSFLASGTAYVTLEDVKVPAANLIGEENAGFKYIMYNFNSERLGLCIGALRSARLCLEESVRYAHKRKTFGKRLIDHAVLRAKIGHMARQIEATQAQMDLITYQCTRMDPMEALMTLGGTIALFKVQCTQVFEYCAREACQIFGGLAFTKGGIGGRVEQLYREVRGFAIPGGSEEVLLDVGVRMAMKLSKANL